MRLEQRIARLEMAARGLQDSGDAELLSPRDVCFLITEQHRLAEEDSLESRLLITRIDAMLESHRRAIRLFRPEPMTPEQATEAVREAADRDDTDEEQFRRKWLERLGAEREYIGEGMEDLDSLEG